MKRTALRQSAPLAVPLGYIHPLLNEFIRLGGSVEDIWREAAINTPMPAVLRGDIATLPAIEFCRLYRSGINAVERLCCAEEGRRPFGKSAVELLCYCVINCESLREVIARAARFNAVMEERGGAIDVAERNGMASFTMAVPGRHRTPAGLLIDVTGLYFYYQLFSWLIGQRLPVADVRIAHLEAHYPLPLNEVFQANILFDQPINALRFPASVLDRRVVRSYAELNQIVDYFPFNLVMNRVGQTTWSDHLRLLLLDSLQHRHRILEFTAVAQLLHLSPATLRRRLAEEGASYAELRVQCLRDVAENLLCETDLTLDDIAARLDFSDERAFRRAFREWMGETPVAFRERRRTSQGTSEELLRLPALR
jgi:AraC-like DNA-binding protein